MQKGVAHDRHARPRVIQQILILVGTKKGVQRYRNGADLDGAKKTISEFRDVRQEQHDTFFHADT